MHQARQPFPLQIERRIVHAVGTSVVPIAAFFLPRLIVISLTGYGALTLLAADLARLAVPSLNEWVLQHFGFLLKPKEGNRLTGATWLAIAGVIAFTLFPMPIPALAVLYLALGDPAASIIGGRFGSIRLGKKSLEGTLAFLSAAMATAVILWSLNAFQTFWPAAVGAIVAAVVELLPLPPDDNFTVPLVTSLAMGLLWVS